MPPAFLQAKPEPKLDPIHMTPYERDMQQAFLGNCRSRGGPESVCQRCAGLLLLARHRNSVCMKSGKLAAGCSQGGGKRRRLATMLRRVPGVLAPP